VNRESLQSVIKWMFLSLLAFLLYVLFSSLSGPSNIVSGVNLYDDVMIGQTAKRRDGPNRVWVTRLSKVQLSYHGQLNEFVVAPNSGCDKERVLCVILAKTARSGIDVVYSATSPDGFPAGVPWYGGFVDPSTGEMFDLFGRAYKTTFREQRALNTIGSNN